MGKNKGITMENAGHKNLKPCKPGETHNPNGRPKGTKNMSTILKEILDNKMEYTDPFTKTKGKVTAKHIVMLKLLQKAMKGDLKAVDMLMDRTEGRSKQIIEQTNKDDMTDEQALIKLREHAEKLGLTFEEYSERMGLK